MVRGFMGAVYSTQGFLINVPVAGYKASEIEAAQSSQATQKLALAFFCFGQLRKAAARSSANQESRSSASLDAAISWAGEASSCTPCRFYRHVGVGQLQNCSSQDIYVLDG